LIGVIILLIFLYFYDPFETFLTESILNIHFSNVISWFASVVGVIGYAVAHWQSFRQNIIRSVTQLEVDGLVFDTLQISILIAVIFCAGAPLQAIEVLAEHLIGREDIIGGEFGEKLLAIILLVILAILFYLLHSAVRASRVGWTPCRPPPRTTSSSSESAS
tara:strand:+ start:842 stop:1327 length:486 start_codon:yes stop_codon:yes gene_type:complete